MSVQIFDDFFDDKLYKEINSHIEIVVKSKQYRLTTNRVWEEGLISYSTPILRYRFEENDKLLFDKIKDEVIKKTEFSITDIIVHIFPKLSYIPWHLDGTYDSALTIYLNKNWDKNWGGLFLYKENNEIKAFIPKKNTGILLEGGIEHCVTTTNINADDRITLQFFLNKKKKIF